MALITMTKLQSILPVSAKRRLLKDFTSLGCVEITTAAAAEQAADLLHKVEPASEVLQHKSSLAQALAVLDRFCPEKKSFLTPKPQITESQLYDNAVAKKATELTAKILETNNSLSSLQQTQNQLEATMAYLSPWAASDTPLHLEGGKHYRIIRGICPASVDIPALLQEVETTLPLVGCELVSRDKEQSYLLFTYHQQAEADIAELFKRINFAKVTFKDAAGTAKDCLQDIRSQLQEAQNSAGELIQYLQQLAQQRPFLEQALDAQSLEAEREITSTQMLVMADTIYFEAWLPEYRQADVEAVLLKNGCAYQFTPPTDADDPPVLLENNRFVRPFSEITRLYGMPAYGSVVDPTFFVAIFFFIFFGIMLGDAMYGLIVAGLTFYVVRKAQPDGSFKNFMLAACAVGISAFMAGALFSSWFGDFPQVLGQRLGLTLEIPPILFAPLDNPILMLVIALSIGIVNLFVGMGLAAYRLVKQGRIWSAVFDIGFWYLIIIGLLLALVPMMTETGNANLGLTIAAIGAGGVFLTAGREKPSLIGKIIGGLGALYGVTSYLSEILSYSRLMALALASSVVAQVMNIMAGMMGNSVIGWVLFAVIFIVGQVFNLLLGVLGAFVHSCRLIFVEFFGKFFATGGREFAPLENKVKYTHVVKEEM